MKYGMNGLKLAILLLCAVGTAAWADGVQRVRHFNADPGWEGVGNQTLPHDFGFSPSNNAGGAAPGEIGGYIERGAPVWYADDQIGTLDLATDDIHVTFKVMVADNGNPGFGYFDDDTFIDSVRSGTVLGFRLDDDRIYALLNGGFDGDLGLTGLTLTYGTPSTIEMNYTAATHTFSLAVDGGAPYVSNVDMTGAILDHIGIMNLGESAGSGCDFWIDDLAYTVGADAGTGDDDDDDDDDDDISVPLPAAPAHPSPPDGATDVPLDTLLRWNTGPALASTETAGDPLVNVLFYTRSSDNSREFPNLLAALRSHFNAFTEATTSTENPSMFAAALAGKHVFVLVEQENWTAPGLAAFGTAVGPVLRQFVENGGLVIVCDDNPQSGSAQFLTNAGLMNVAFGARASAYNAHVVAAHPVTSGVSANFNALNGAVRYASVGDAQILAAENNTNFPLAAARAFGAGNVVLFGWDYWSYNADMALMLANAVRYLNSASDAFPAYDVLFDTTNPPTTPLIVGTGLVQADPGPLDFGTTYFWQVVARNSAGTAPGPVWSFQTIAPPLPDAPSQPSPVDGAGAISLTPNLSWNAGSVPATFTVLLDTTNPPTAEVADALAQPHFAPEALAPGTTYFWRVIAGNSTGDTPGPVWRFSTNAPPLAPHNPIPADGATDVPLDILLRWNAQVSLAGEGEAAKQVLFFTGHSDNTREYPNTVSALNEHFSAYSASTTTTESPSALAAELADKQAFVLVEQEIWDSNGMAAFGTAVGPVLRAFVQTGGLVVVCDYGPEGGAAQFLTNAGLMNVTHGIRSTSPLAVGSVSSHPILAGIASSFLAADGNARYASVGDAQVLVAESAAPNRPVAAIKPIGAGSVLLLGWDYWSYNADMGRLLANAVEQLGGSTGGGLTLYDVFFGVENPPTAPLTEAATVTEAEPGPLDYNTTYYWRVVARNALDSTPGPVWSFTTLSLPAPETPSLPGPLDGADYAPLNLELSWNAGSVPATFSVLLDTANPPATQVADELSAARFSPEPLLPHTTYYWRIISSNSTGATPGPIWSFSTLPLSIAPHDPSPRDGAVNVPLDSLLSWQGESGLPSAQTAGDGFSGVRVLFFTGHADVRREYPRMLEAIQAHFGGFVATTTNAETPAALAADLIDKQVFVLVEQEQWTTSGMAAFGTAVGDLLRRFVEAGGLVIACDDDPIAGTAHFLSNAGLMNVIHEARTEDVEVQRVGSHAILEGVAADFTAGNGTARYSDVGDAQVLVATADSAKPMAAIRPIGAGNVLLLGWDYNTYGTDQSLILANAVRLLGGSGGGAFVRYQGFFGPDNPPATSLIDQTFATAVDPGTLAFNTTYYWRVVAGNAAGSTTGPVWSFTTSRQTAGPIGVFAPLAGSSHPDYSLLAVDWQSDPRVTGSAVEFQLLLDGRRVAFLGEAWDQDSTALTDVFLPLLPTSGDYRVRVISLWDPTLFGDSARFTIEGNPIRVVLPDGDEYWPVGSQQVVYWKTNTAFAGTAVRLELRAGDQKIADLGESWHPAGEKLESITVPNVPQELMYYVRAISLSNPEYFADSANYATVGLSHNAVAPDGWALYR